MRRELPLLSDIHIARCYSPSGFSVSSVQLHGAYGGVVYLRLTDPAGNVHTEIVVAKTKVSPIKRLSIPRLELCGAQLLTKLLCHGKRILNIPVTSVFAWTDSTIVLTWLTGNPRRFKTYVGNRISFIIDQLPPPPPPPPIVGGMSLAHRILPIVPRGDFSLYNSTTTTSGGMAPSGFDSTFLTGLYNQVQYLRPFRRKNERFVI